MSGYPTIEILYPLPALTEQKCFQAISENVNNTLCPCCIPTALKQEYCVRGWEVEGVDVLREYRTCYNGQALGTFSPREATMARAQSLSAEALESVGSCDEIHNLPLPASPTLVCPWKHAAKPNTH